MTYLAVHKDIDNGVVDSGTFGKVGWKGGHQRVESVARMRSGKAGKEGVGPPAEAVCEDHHHHHARHLPLRLLGGLGFFLLLRHLREVESCTQGQGAAEALEALCRRGLCCCCLSSELGKR